MKKRHWMNRYGITKAIAVTFCVSLLGLSACSKPDSAPDAGGADVLVTVNLSDYEVSDGYEGDEPDLSDLRACLFENGRMTKVYDRIATGVDRYGFRLDRDAGTLYVLTHAADLVDLDGLCAAGVTETEWLSSMAATKEGVPVKFWSGKTSLSGSKEQTIQLSRGYARFDLRVRTEGTTEITTVTLVGMALHTKLFAESETVSAEHGNLTLCPDEPYTEDRQGVAYVYEYNNPEAVVQVEALIDDRPYILQAALPSDVRRNQIYIITLTKGKTDQTAQLTVEPWDDGGDIGIYPDWDGRITIDAELSDLPSGAVVSENGMELTLLHNQADFVLALECDNELEILPVEGNTVTVEPIDLTRGIAGRNLFHVRKSLYAPGMQSHDLVLRFRRKGLTDVYPEDVIQLHLEANPVALEGELHFDPETYTHDFGRYVDNELGRFVLPSDKELIVEFPEGEDAWVKLVPQDGESGVWRVLGGWRPNDPTADGRAQYAVLVVRNAADGSMREEYRIARRNYGLPVTWLHGVWWCKYNARGNSRDFEDQILSATDPAVAAGQSVLDYLRDCSAEEFYRLWGWAYQGDSGEGMRVVDQEGVLVMENFSTNVSAHINKLPADALAPEGYELPSMEEFNRLFDATDYVWMMWNGTHVLRAPWEGHSRIKREQRRRNDVTVGSVQATDLIYVGLSSPDFPEYEPVTWYGPGAQWNAGGIQHSNHYNNILFGVYSPEGSGWYMSGGMSALYMQKNGAGNRDTRILRFKKSPVEYIY